MELQREMAQISRSSEFFSVAELAAQTGQPKENFATVALKELMDNACDACETGSDPEVSIVITKTADSVRIAVSDNGPGLAASTIDRIKNFDIRVSNKLNYRAPTRGQQGNALKTVLGMPYALGYTAPVVIRSHGLEHKIYASPDPLGSVVVNHTKQSVDTNQGTTIELTLPQNPAAARFFPQFWVRAYGLANPNIRFNFRFLDETQGATNHDNSDVLESEKKTVLNRKFMSTDLTAPSWYNADTLKRQIFTIVRNNGDLPLREYVKSFRGLSTNANAKAVCDDQRLEGIRHLSDLEARPEKITDLLDVMEQVARPPSPSILGMIGKESIRARFDDLYGIDGDRFFYKRDQCVYRGIPYIIEAATAEVKGQGDAYHILNFSPSFDDPLSQTLLRAEDGKVYTRGCQNFMAQCFISPHAQYITNTLPNVVYMLHIISPAFEFLDRGKTHISLPNEVADVVSDCLWAVSKTFYTEGKRREKDAARAAKQEEKRQKQEERSDELKLKDAIYLVLPEAYRMASQNGTLPVSDRDLYYAIRMPVQQYTSAELTQSYCREVVIDYKRKFGGLEMHYYDPRGYLIEPDGTRIELGTREVAAYRFPVWKYDKILCVEKKGVIEPFLAAKFHERYDLCIVAGEGYATEAIRTLLQKADRTTDYKLFVMHDADPYGYEIARTVQEETDRMPGYKVNVIDIGLSLPEAMEMGLETESFTRKKALSEKLIPRLNPLELELFTGTPFYAGPGKKYFKAQRVELNALGPAERIAFLEQKLKEHGALAKVCPPEGVLQEHASATFERTFKDRTRKELMERFEIDKLVDEAMAGMEMPDFTDTIEALKEKLSTNPTENWEVVLDELVEEMEI